MTQQHPTWPVEPMQFSRLRRESLLLEATALSNGLDTMRIGTRGFTAGHAPRCADIAFQDTISQETSRSAVRTAEDRLTAKTALTEANLRVPQSRRFGYKNIDEAVEYAQSFRRGAIIKPRMADAGRVSRKALTEPADIREAIESWRQITGAHATYLVERRMFSREYSFIIVDGEVASAGLCRNRRWEKEVTSVHPEVLDLAVQAFNAFPAMPHAEVRMFCQDAFAGPERCVVASVSPEIGLISVRKPQEWSTRVAEHLIECAARYLRIQPTTGGVHVNATFVMNELSDPRVMAQGITRWLDRAGVVGAASAGGRIVTGVITGTPGELVTLSGLAKAGRLSSESPQSITFAQQGPAREPDVRQARRG